MRLLIADDHALLREGLKQILVDEFPEAEFGQAGTVQETLAQLAGQSWDALLLDIFMPEGGGLEVLQQLAVRQSGLPVLVLSSAPEEQMAVRVLQAGAAGYLNKQAAAECLVEALKKVMSGGRYLSGPMAERLVGQVARGAAPGLPHERLSDREFQVFQLLVSGKSVKAIAGELALSSKTISTFRSRILEKLQLQNDVQLVHYAMEHRLLESKPAL